LRELASLTEFLEGHFLTNEAGGAGLDLLPARGADALHFLI
jgi:hypothetical protein